MAVTFDAATSTSGNRVASLTFNLTIGAGVTNGAVLIGIQDDDTGGRTISSVTVGGAAATLLRRDGGSGSHSAIYWFASGSSTGAKSIVVTMSGAVSGDLIAGAVSFSGADQTTPAINGVGGTGTTTVPSLTVTSAAADMTFDSTHGNGNASTLTVGGGQTQRWNVTGPRDSTKGAASTAAGAASVSMTWTASGTTLTSHSACDVLAAAAAVVIPAIEQQEVFPDRMSQEVVGF